MAAVVPDVARMAQGFDQLGLDSDYGYNPLWQKCRELGTAPTFHTGGRSFGERNSPTNFIYNCSTSSTTQTVAGNARSSP